MCDIVSIIVPVYKVDEVLLRKSIESILNQTYRGLEILLIDDGSPDDAGIICDEYEKLDSRIKVFHLSNGGVSKARNFALEKASGNYIMFVDSDDYIECSCVDILLKNLKNVNADCAMCATSYIYEGKIQPKMQNEKPQYRILCQPQAMDALFYLQQIYRGYEVAAVWGCLYRREIIKDIFFNENMKIGEDFVFKYEAFLNVNKVVCTNQKLYSYVIRKESTMRNGFNPQKINTIDELDKLIGNDHHAEYRNGLISRSVNIAIVILFMIPIGKQYNFYRECVKNFIKKYRCSALLNPKSRIKVRVALLLSYFGFNTIQRIFRLVR